MAGCTGSLSSAPTAMLISIGDGDTLRVAMAGQRLSVRLACIDAPERSQRPEGLASRAYLRGLLPVGRSLRVVVKDRDRYGRLVAEVMAGDGAKPVNINLAMVAAGQAFVYPAYVRQCDVPLFRAAEQGAMQRGDGVWHRPGGTTRPWEYRQQRRQGHSPASASAAES
jgi:endonuclease YncB( thermonuclease family)